MSQDWERTIAGGSPRWRLPRAGLVAIATLLAAAIAASPAVARTWHVQAGAAPGGDGSGAAPLDSLQEVEAASRTGDRILVERAPSRAAPLDGGIQLKRGQTLRGAGSAVAGAGRRGRLPVVTNSNPGRLSGDAIRLADGAKVSNLVVRAPSRGGIYGLDTVGVRVLGNDVSGHNTSCRQGFSFGPTIAPLAYPGTGVRIGPLINGWAGIMVDGETAKGSIKIRDNEVHDADCGDGIDIRAAGSSRLTANVSRNLIRRLEQGPDFQSVLGIGTQASDSATLRSRQRKNRVTRVTGDDCEGLFLEARGTGSLVQTVERTRVAHTLGGDSCNGVEAIVSSGEASIDFRLRDSVLEDNTGDMLQEANLGAGSRMRWVMRDVVVRETHERGENGPFSSDPGGGLVPFNTGDCMLIGQNGGGNTTHFRMRNSSFEGCNNGITAGSNKTDSPPNGLGPPDDLALDIARSRIVDVDKFGVQALVGTDLPALRMRVAESRIARARGFGVGVDLVPGATVDRAKLDFGGGALASGGGNCLVGSARGDLETTAFELAAGRNWWGQLGGPSAGQLVTNAGGSVSAGKPLTARPRCGPRRRRLPGG